MNSETMKPERAALLAAKLAGAYPGRRITKTTIVLWAETLAEYSEAVAVTVVGKTIYNMVDNPPSVGTLHDALANEARGFSQPSLGGTVQPKSSAEKICEMCGEVMLRDDVASDKERTIWFHANVQEFPTLKSYLASDFHKVHDPNVKNYGVAK